MAFFPSYQPKKPIDESTPSGRLDPLGLFTEGPSQVQLGAQIQQMQPPQAPILPDYVNPLTQQGGVVTSTMGGDHPYGEDVAYPAEGPTAMTNPIGGTPFSGSIKDAYGNLVGYGNYLGTIGGSPEEQAQITPEEKIRMYTVANEYMANNPENISGLQSLFPGKNINIQGHLANPVSSGLDMATGSAQLEMGSTGHSTGKHLHDELLNTQGQFSPLSQNIIKALQEKVAREEALKKNPQFTL